MEEQQEMGPEPGGERAPLLQLNKPELSVYLNILLHVKALEGGFDRV